MKETLTSYFRLVKFSHTIFALPFALIGFFMAVKYYSYEFKWPILIFVLLCMVLARNTAMAFNRLADRDFDKRNPRTSKREIPAKIISTRNAAIFIIINSILFITLTYFINSLSFYLSPIAIGLVMFYSYTKRFTLFAHIFLGLALAIAPAGAFIAISGTLTFPIILLSGIVLLWTAGFDIIYSLQDEEFDRENNLHSIPAKFGIKKALVISTLLHIICLIVLAIWLWLTKANIIALLGASIFSGLLIYQHLIIKPSDLTKINMAFGTLNGIASVVLATFIIISYFI